MKAIHVDGNAAPVTRSSRIPAKRIAAPPSIVSSRELFAGVGMCAIHARYAFFLGVAKYVTLPRYYMI
jgi:hypothetical protein